jgi:signal transduction histidine kinase
MSIGMYRHSLRFRITLGLAISLLVTLFLLSYMQYSRQRAVLMNGLKVAATNAGAIVEGTLEHSLATRDLAAVQRTMDDVVRQQGVLSLFIVDEAGEVVLAAGESRPAALMPESDPTCQVCHASASNRHNESVVLSGHYGVRAYRNVNSLESWQQCPECGMSEASSAVLITDLSMEDVDRQLAALARNSVLWSGASILAILLIVNVMLNEMVIRKLALFVRAIVRVSEGDLEHRIATDRSDEIGALADAFDRMADGLKEKEKLEEALRDRSAELQAHAQRLAALNAVAATINQSLNLRDILDRALDQVLQLAGFGSGWIVLCENPGGGCQLAASRGPAAMLPSSEAPQGLKPSLSAPPSPGQAIEGSGPERSERRVWTRCVCKKVLEQSPIHECGPVVDCPCPDGGRTPADSPVMRVCVPLNARERLLGVMGLCGTESTAVQALRPEMTEMLTIMGQQIGVAIENARLYEELRQKDAVRQRLLQRVITVQEEERKRIARELHDETSQALTSLLVRLQVLERTTSLSAVRSSLGDLRSEVAKTLEKVHELALELRPSVLDDLGLVAALRRHLRDFEGRFQLPIDFQVLGLDEERLPADVETALYRITQEALTNVARHARATNVSVLLEKRGQTVALVVEDDGQGFDVGLLLNSPPGKGNLGLHGMQERASLLGGTVTIESGPASGTSLFVEIPLDYEASGEREYQENPSAIG